MNSFPASYYFTRRAPGSQKTLGDALCDQQTLRLIYARQMAYDHHSGLLRPRNVTQREDEVRILAGCFAPAIWLHHAKYEGRLSLHCEALRGRYFDVWRVSI